MMQLVWSQLWHHAHESFWSLLMKIAFASGVNPPNLAGRWMDEPLNRRIAATLPTSTQSMRICEELELPASAGLDLFAELSTGQYVQRERYQLRMRWCPECAKYWFHSPLFQEWRRSRCPWHGIPLTDACPRCLRSIDPLEERPWTCRHCGTRIAPFLSDWPVAFEEAPSQGDKVKHAFMHTCVTTEHSRIVEYLFTEADTAQLATHSDYFSPFHKQLVGVAFEETSALVDGLLGRHRLCIKKEFMTDFAQYRDISFKCPVAAAAIYVALITGSETEALGRWPHRPGNYRSPVSIDVGTTALGAPKWLGPILTREYVRSILRRTLRVFAQYGWQRRLQWKDPGLPKPRWSSTGEYSARIEPGATIAEVEEAIEDAAIFCPY